MNSVIVNNFGEEFVVFENVSDFIPIYVWLTTTELQDIKDGKQYISGLSNTIAEAHRDIPNNPTKPQSNKYWCSYSWVWKTFVYPDNQVHFDFYYTHFKMNSFDEFPYPPIPKHLFDFYNQYKDKVDIR